MNNKEILKYPNPFLKKKSVEIKEITPEIKELVLKMAQTMKNREGVGIAAPQLGLLKRLIVVQMEKGPQAFVNPEIIRKSRKQEIMEEGCLSLPSLFLKIKRAKEVEIEALNINGNKIRIKTEGFLARIFQHEIDHLDGILIIDHVRVGRRIWRLLKFYLKSKK